MKRILMFPLIIVLSAVISYSCTGKTTPDSPVLATVGDTVITEEDFLNEISRVPAWAREQLSSEEGKRRFLDDMVKREIVYQEAMRMRLHKDIEYEKRLGEFEKVTLVSMILKREVDAKVAIDDAEMKDFFEKNKDKLTVGTELKASHILVQSSEEANEIYESLKKGGEFEKLARVRSADKQSAARGGDLGYFGKGKMVPEFERAVARMNVGEVSEPVRTRFGYHIIKLVDVKKGKPASYEQARDSIRRQLVAQKRKGFFDAYVDGLRGKNTIEKSEENLVGIALPWSSQAADEPAPPPAE